MGGQNRTGQRRICSSVDWVSRLVKQLGVAYSSYCCVACAGCCKEPIKITRQLGNVLIFSDGVVEPLELMQSLTTTERVILMRTGISSPRPVAIGQLTLYNDSSPEGIRSHVSRLNHKIGKYGLRLRSYKGFALWGPAGN